MPHICRTSMVAYQIKWDSSQMAG